MRLSEKIGLLITDLIQYQKDNEIVKIVYEEDADYYNADVVLPVEFSFANYKIKSGFFDTVKNSITTFSKTEGVYTYTPQTLFEDILDNVDFSYHPVSMMTDLASKMNFKNQNNICSVFRKKYFDKKMWEEVSINTWIKHIDYFHSIADYYYESPNNPKTISNTYGLLLLLKKVVDKDFENARKESDN